MDWYVRLPASRLINMCAAALIAAGGAFTHLAQSAPKTLPADLPATMFAPPPRPAASEDKVAIAVPTQKPARTMPGPKTSDVLPADERACRSRLHALGVTFSEQPRVDGGGEGECSISFPIEVTSLAKDVDLTPTALMNCATAEAAAQLALETIKPAARRELGASLSGIRQASAYVCRIRAGGTKISEHARGNALDIAAFMLDDGRTIDVQAYGPTDKPERKFMRAVRGKACGPFKTVLGPGTNADHATHLHLDLAERRRGSTYCH